MNKLTKAQMKALVKAEPWMRKAMNDYLPQPPIEIKELLKDMYKAVFEVSMTSSSCNKCLLRDTKRLAEVYYKQKEEEENKKANKEE